MKTLRKVPERIEWKRRGEFRNPWDWRDSTRGTRREASQAARIKPL